MLGELYFVEGDKEKAKAAFAAALPALESGERDNPNEWSAFLVAQAYAGLGRKDEAVREGKRATELMPESKSAWHGGMALAELAQIYAMLGDADNALPILTHLLSIPSETHKEQLRYDPVWDPIRRDPRFQKLLKQPERAL